MYSRVRVVARPNNVGIGRDIELLRGAVEAVAPVEFSPYRSVSPFHRWTGRRGRDEAVIFLGRVRGRWLRHGGARVLIPNQERFPTRLISELARVDQVWCKTQHAAEVFGRLHASVHYVGFTSVDRQLAGVRPDPRRFVHVAGRSTLKGTAAVARAWLQNPHWPPLTVVRHTPPEAIEGVPTREQLPRNMEWIDRHLPDEELRDLQNRCGVHLCPSEAEGWGHYIAEAMSCRAVVVTTDAPPMNELVGADRGVLVSYETSEPRGLGVTYAVNESAIESAVNRVLDQPVEDLRELGRASRLWFEQNDRDFRGRAAALMRGLLRGA